MRTLPKTISEKEVLTMIKATKNNKLKLAIMLGFYQCMRVSEVLSLLPKHIDKDRNYLHIIGGKGEKDRDITITPPVKKGLKNLPISIHYRTLLRAVKGLAKRTIGKDITFHQLRHSGATFYLNEKGLDLRNLQNFLGHSRIDTTTIYTHITPASQKKVFDKIWEDESG
jgi:integrase